PHYENVPFEVPEGWVWTTLEEICLFLSRGKSPKYSDTDKTYPVFAQKCNLKEGGISLEQARFLDPSTICKWSEEYRLKTGDVLVNSTGTGTVGRTRLFHEGYLKNHPFVVPDSHVSVIRTTNEVKSEFVFAYISSQLIQQYLEDNLAGSTNQKELYIGVLSDLSFPLPPLAEQHRIVVEIERWFSLIDIIETGKDDLQTAIKQTKSKILDLAIHGKLVPQDPNDEPAIELLKRINPDFTPCDNGHYPQLPDGWCYSTIKEVFIINPRNKVDDDVEVGFVPMANITDGYNNTFKYEKKRWGKIKTGFTHFADGDIAVAKISPCLENLKSVVLKGLPNGIGAGTTELHVFRSQFMDIQYGLYFFKSDYFISQCVGSFNGVVGQQRVSKNIIEDIIIAIPPINEQKRIVYTISKIFAQLDIIMGSL
ncbi:restriction endonuclease subunit S, partial [Bacteroides acidifaciens]|uniref:restriction endonuclease subunit S n=1 Tax=Bacteroides acidifaciens TaxID=85831 RepID=UPI0025B45DE7